MTFSLLYGMQYFLMKMSPLIDIFVLIPNVHKSIFRKINSMKFIEL